MSIVDFLVSTAHAQIPSGSESDRTVEPAMLSSAMGEVAGLTLLALAVAGFLLLIKLYARWPKAEPWLVTASLAAFIPVGSVVLYYATNGHAAYHESLPALVVIAPLLGGVWWLVKTKTRWLEGPADASAVSAKREATRADERPSPRPAPPPVEPKRETAKPQPAPPAAAAASASSKDRIFISYRRHDSADITGRIYDRLVQRFGKDQVFKDVDSIPLGVDFREHLGNVVGRCNLVLAVIGDQWLTSAAAGGGHRLDDAKDFVRIELESALERRIPVIPLLVRGAAVPSDSELPPSLAALTYRNGISVRPDPDFHRDIDRLIAGLETHLGS